MSPTATRDAPRPLASSAHTTGPDQGVIEEARRRQRHRRRRRLGGALATAAAIGALLWGLLAGGGAGGAGHGSRDSASGSTPSYGIGAGITVSYPRGWHLLTAPITSLRYPYDRLLLTSYPAARGGNCGPTRAENALPASGALIFLFEYTAVPGGVFGQSKGMSFPSQSAGIALRRSDLANYECSTVPNYLIRFKTAGRLFQAQVAFGTHATRARRAEALQILSSLHAKPLADTTPG
jgi:hypothetical protein